jgi:hypothetical protein
MAKGAHRASKLCAAKATHSSKQQYTFAVTSPFSSATVASTTSPLSSAISTAASAISTAASAVSVPEPQRQKQKYTKRGSTTSSSKSTFQSPKHKLSPLPRVPHKNMKKLPCEKTDEEIDAAVDAHYEKWKIDMANKKKPIESFFPVTIEDKSKAAALKIQLHQPIVLTLDYNRSIIKSAKAKEQRVGKEVAQLGQQKNQSIEPLKVYDTNEW